MAARVAALWVKRFTLRAPALETDVPMAMPTALFLEAFVHWAVSPSTELADETTGLPPFVDYHPWRHPADYEPKRCQRLDGLPMLQALPAVPLALRVHTHRFASDVLTSAAALFVARRVTAVMTEVCQDNAASVGKLLKGYGCHYNPADLEPSSERSSWTVFACCDRLYVDGVETRCQKYLKEVSASATEPAEKSEAEPAPEAGGSGETTDALSAVVAAAAEKAKAMVTRARR
eukprot:TRINITY_DN26969_c0_g1_i2.p1 TRINITY_DN26969_c0_g1~~TRINITY_DN26969_c0_g1_i2.p1  ORF type:complete len:270 (+),score=51.80 TRINITY_DN26969_c0_g1_i2:112-810(+)